MLAGFGLVAVFVTACYESDTRPPAPAVEGVLPHADPASQVFARGVAAGKRARTAGPRGRASVVLRETGGGSDIRALVGDTITVEVAVDAGGDAVTGMALFLDVDDNALEPVSADSGAAPVRPFRQGEFLDGDVYENDTIGDTIGDPLANGLAKYQLRYYENVPPNPFGPVRAAAGSGVLARFRVRVVGTRATTLTVVDRSPTGSSTGYFVSDKPGVTHGFAAITEMHITPTTDRRVKQSTDGSTRLEVTVLRGGRIATDVAVRWALSVSGRGLDYSEAVSADEDGTARLSIDPGRSGYYTIRADANGVPIGTWPSLPINEGRVYRLVLEAR